MAVGRWLYDNPHTQYILHIDKRCHHCLYVWLGFKIYDSVTCKLLTPTSQWMIGGGGAGHYFWVLLFHWPFLCLLPSLADSVTAKRGAGFYRPTPSLSPPVTEQWRRHEQLQPEKSPTAFILSWSTKLIPNGRNAESYMSVSVTST